MNEAMIDQGITASLWAVCDCFGKVTLCGRDASDFGIVPGSDAALMISEDCVCEFEDALVVAKSGGVVDLILPATRNFIAHIKSDELFSVPVIHISLYKNKNEYLAETLSTGDKFGKVFSHMAGDPIGTDDLVTTDVTLRARAIAARSELLRGIPAEVRTGDVSSDVSALYKMIAEKLSANAENRFRVDFASDVGNEVILCPIDPRMFAGATVMSARVGSRLSAKGDCRVVLSTDTGRVTLAITSKMHGKCGRSLKCSDLGKLCEYIPSTPAELIILEGMVSEFGWDSIFECKADGSFTIRITFDRGADTDRLKFREEISLATEYVDTCLECLKYVNSSESK